MSKRIKCETCNTVHGGFHLCLGRPWQEYESGTPLKPSPELAATFGKNHKNRGRQAEAAREAQYNRWEQQWAKTKDRDEAIVKAYEDGLSLPQLGKHYGLSKTQVQRIIVRLGGTMRPRGTNQWNVKTHGR